MTNKFSSRMQLVLSKYNMAQAKKKGVDKSLIRGAKFLAIILQAVERHAKKGEDKSITGADLVLVVNLIAKQDWGNMSTVQLNFVVTALHEALADTKGKVAAIQLAVSFLTPVLGFRAAAESVIGAEIGKFESEYKPGDFGAPLVSIDRPGQRMRKGMSDVKGTA